MIDPLANVKTHRWVCGYLRSDGRWVRGHWRAKRRTA